MAEPRRILLAHSADEGYGSDRILVHVCDLLLRRGHHVEVLLPSDSGPGWLSKQLKIRGVDVHVRDLAVARRRVFSPQAFPLYALSTVRAQLSVRRLMRSRQFDMIYINSLALLALIFGVTVRRRDKLLHCHEIVTTPSWMARLSTRATKRVGHVIAVSDAVRDALDATNVSVVRNGIPDARCTPRPDQGDDLVVLFVGRLSEWKGVGDLLDVARELAAEPIRFIIAGGPVPGEDQRAREVATSCAESGGRVTYVGEVESADELIEMADVLVVPSRRPDPYPTVVLEGMRGGCVVIATDGGGAKEAIQDGIDGFIVAMNRPDEFVSRIRQLATDPELRASMASSARRSYEQRHTLEAFHNRLEPVLEGLGL